jgi:hypothetical protein
MGTPKFIDAIGLDQVPTITEIKDLTASALKGKAARARKKK